MPLPKSRTARIRASSAPLGAVRTLAGTRVRSGLSPAREWAFLTGTPYPDTPMPATETEAMGLPPFGRGVALLCNAVAGTGWEAVRTDPETGVTMARPDQPAVLTDPTTGIMTPWNYRYAATADLILYGNHFAFCGTTDSVTRRPGYLVPIGADRVGVLVDPDPDTPRVWFTVDGILVEPFDPNNPPRADIGADGRAVGDWTGTLFHVSAGNRSGEILGLGVLAEYAAWLGGAVAAEEHAGAYFAGGALPPAVLQSPQVLQQAQADDLKAKWRTMVSTREPVILPSGYVLTPIVSDAVNAQMVESRQWNAADIAMMLGIPAYKLGLAGPSMTYQNIESADIEFVRDSVDRYAAPLTASFTQWLMPLGTSVAWNYSGRMRADQTTTATVINSYVQSGILSPDEARAILGRPPRGVVVRPGSLPPQDAPPEPVAPPMAEPDQTTEPVISDA